jgi:DNA-binding NarL/FixJ family response regulator
MIRLVLVDDQDLIRRGMRALLNSDPSLELVGEADDGQTALQVVAQHQPDVVLMDIRMPGMDGVAATRAISQTYPQVKVLILTTFDDQDYVQQALAAGAVGYLLKDTPFEELTQAIHLVEKGYTQLSPGLIAKMLAATSPPTQPPSQPDLTLLSELTPRERDILYRIAQGANNREIAEQLFLSEKTVRNHVSNLLSRLGLRDRTQAAIYVHEIGGSEAKKSPTPPSSANGC